MAKVIAVTNMTLDGYCDHTALSADDETHQHYTELLRRSGTALYGRITYQLMEYWRTVLEDPTAIKAMNDFAVAIDTIPKIVFSRTLKDIDWQTAKLATKDLKEEVLELKQEPGKDILVGSPGLIAALTRLDLIDEYQIAVHPTVVGGGLTLFKNITERVDLKLKGTKTFGCGAIFLFYERPEKL